MQPKRKLKNTLRQMAMKTQKPYKIYGMQLKQILVKYIMIHVFLKKKKKKIQINNLTYHLKELEKEEQTKPKVNRRMEIIKIKKAVNKIEIKINSKKKSIKPRAGSLKEYTKLTNLWSD